MYDDIIEVILLNPGMADALLLFGGAWVNFLAPLLNWLGDNGFESLESSIFVGESS